MSDLRKAFIEVWMAFGDLFHDLAHGCYRRAGQLTKENESCGCEAEHLGPDGYGCKLNRTGTEASTGEER